ncbi:MAG: hypothetical protein ABEJ62_02135, partial [Candidatus Nanohaloarchaea archaeon]
ILKGYLEFKFEIEREMTYAELADELEGRKGKHLDEMVKFFRNLAKDEYAGTMDEEEIDSIVETAEKVVKAM